MKLGRCSLGRAALAMSAFGLLLAEGAAAATTEASEPSQRPLLVPPGASPKPSVLLMLDDALSMHAQSMPDASAQVNGRVVRLPDASVAGEFVDAAPDDASPRAGLVPLGVAPAERHGSSVFQRQFRSPDVNAAYYDPAVRYRTWPDVRGGRMPAADPAHAPWDPLAPARGAIDLRASGGAVFARWCWAVDRCEDGLREFAPALVYRLKPNGDPTSAGDYVELDLTIAGARFPKAEGRNDCAATDVCSQAEELVNFANWFVYHRSRWLAEKSAALEAVAGASPWLRVGLGSLGTAGLRIDGEISDGILLGVREPDAAGSDGALSRLQALQPTGARRLNAAISAAGRYFRRTDGGSPWRDAPGAGTAGGFAECRRAAAVLVAAGAASDPGGADEVDARDGPDHAIDDPLGQSPTRYLAQRPYAEARAGTLADHAMRDYVDDLLPAAANRVMPTADDPAYWQHLGWSTIAFGIEGRLDPSRDLDALTRGLIPWSTAPADDLWHMALDTRGTHQRVRSAAGLSSALQRAVDGASSPSAIGSAAASAGSRLVGANRKFVASYVPGAWTGDVAAYSLDAQGRASIDPLWRASAAVPEAASRRLWTWDRSAARAVTFDWQAMGAADRARLGSGGSETLVRYLRGESIDATDSAAPPYRRRTGRLGDFVGTTPLPVPGELDSRFDALSGAAGEGYRAFVESERRQTPVVFAGGNDGMLHVFRDGDGAELFGFVPRDVLPNLALLADPAYGSDARPHRFFVDGPLAATDAFIARSGAAARWRRLVVGALGAGGKGLFAIDASDPSALDASSVLWERTDEDDADLGHVMSAVGIGVLPGGRWKVFAGNGAHSAAGRAALLVIDLESGAVDKIVLDGAGGNGLMGITLLKNAAQETVGAYAGDLRGQLWRIDFAGSAPAAWRVGYRGRPLIVAGSAGGQRQAIVAAPSWVPHPQLGQIVVFGTGRLIDDADALDRSPQSAYGVWDAVPIGRSSADAAPIDAAAPARSLLVAQRISSSARETATGRYFDVSNDPVDGSTKKGWLVDLPASVGWRVLQPPQALGEFVRLEAVVPGTPDGGCDQGRPGVLGLLLQAANGGQFDAPVFDTDGDGVIGNGDLHAAAFAAAVSQGASGLLLAPAASAGIAAAGGNIRQRGEIVDAANSPRRFQTYCVARCAKRIVDRTWQPILNPPVAPVR